MKTIIVMFAVVLAFGLSMGCSGASKNGSSEGSENLCKEYDSCNACIAGLQKNRGIDAGQAQTECSMAVTGCFTTWEKPVKCGD